MTKLISFEFCSVKNEQRDPHGKYFLSITSVAIGVETSKGKLFAYLLSHPLEKNTVVQVTFLFKKPPHSLAFLSTEFENSNYYSPT